MCYFLYLASPLTLSEIRAMLPEGVTADLADSSEQKILRSYHRGIQTVARLLIGRCSCAFLGDARADEGENERHLRARYRAMNLSRDHTISALERHRASRKVPEPENGWAGSLVDFVREHSRNARVSIYQLTFEKPPAAPLNAELRKINADRITRELESWLVEGSPVLVTH